MEPLRITHSLDPARSNTFLGRTALSIGLAKISAVCMTMAEESGSYAFNQVAGFVRQLQRADLSPAGLLAGM